MAFWVHLASTRHPERVALEGAERSVTYRELSRRAVQGAGGLAKLGVAPGDRVAVEIEDSIEFAAALHACLLHASPAVPVDLRLSVAERSVRSARGGVVVRGRLGAAGDMAYPQATYGLEARIATVMHTSGTTAAPKPVELTYGNWEANAVGSALALGLDPAERWLCVMPLAHVGGLSILIRSTIYATTVILHDRFDVDAVVEELMNPDRRITMVSLVPTMLARLLDAGLRRPPTLRWALLGGGPIASSLLQRAESAAVPVAPTYGMTEACSQIATFGVPLHGVDLRTSGGEIIVRGPVVAPGAVDAEGWLWTGDLGEFIDGRLRIVGRRSDTIVSGGENVAPAEVEAILLEHPAVVDAGVHARGDAEWGEAVVASVVLRVGERLSESDLREFCGERLARFKVPKEIRFVDELPRNVSGKLLRDQLSAAGY